MAGTDRRLSLFGGLVGGIEVAVSDGTAVAPDGTDVLVCGLLGLHRPDRGPWRRAGRRPGRRVLCGRAPAAGRTSGPGGQDHRGCADAADRRQCGPAGTRLPTSPWEAPLSAARLRAHVTDQELTLRQRARTGARRTLPYRAATARALALAICEVEAGLRSASQLERIRHPSLWAAVANRIERVGGPPVSAASDLRVQVQELTPGLVDAAEGLWDLRIGSPVPGRCFEAASSSIGGWRWGRPLRAPARQAPPPQRRRTPIRSRRGCSGWSLC